MQKISVLAGLCFVAAAAMCVSTASLSAAMQEAADVQALEQTAAPQTVEPTAAEGGAVVEATAAYTSSFEPTAWSERPIVIAHRGASGYRPEHTLSGYQLAIDQGADYIEPDLVMTKDGYLVARHDVYLSGSTNVADLPVYKDRKRTFAGRDDWFVFDFTLSELRTLRTRQPRPSRGRDYDGAEQVPTFDEIIDFVIEQNKTGRTVGLYPEMKHPQAFLEAGLNPTPRLVQGLARLKAAGVPVYVQCFELPYLETLAGLFDARYIYLVEGVEKGGKAYPPEGLDLKALPSFVSGIGAYKALILDKKGAFTDFASAVKAAGLQLHVWTLRNDDVGRGYGSISSELEAYYGAGVDGVFADFPDTAIKVRDQKRLLAPPAVIN